MKREIVLFAITLGVFFFLYYLPTEVYAPLSAKGAFLGGLFSGILLLQEYAREHVLTCLVPAFFIAGAVSVFIQKDVVLKYLGGQTKKVVSYALASVSGAVLAVCSCTILPLFAGIRRRGAGLGPAVTFLFSGPAVNIAAVFLTVSVLGAQIGGARVISAVLLSVLVGVSMQAIFREVPEEGEIFIEKKEKPTYNNMTVLFFMVLMVAVLVIQGLAIPALLKYTLLSGLTLSVTVLAVVKFEKETNRAWLKETWSFAKMLLPVLFIGVFLVGGIMPFLPENLIVDYVGANTVRGNLVASIFGAFMYFSTLTEVPILQALLEKGMHQGPALALLLAGPSLSLPNMLVVRKILGTKKTAVYVLLVIVYASLAGYIFGGLV